MTVDRSRSLALIWLRGLQRFALEQQAVITTAMALVLTQVLIAGVGFVTRVAVANSLGAEVFGALAFAVAIGTYGQVFVQFGLDKSLVREFVHHPHRFAELLRASLWIRVILLGFLLLGGANFLWFRAKTSMDQAWELFPAVLATVLGAFQLNGVFDALQKMQRHAFYCMVERLTYFVCVWCLVLTGWSLSLAQLGWLMVATVSLGLALQFRWIWNQITPRGGHGVRETAWYLMRSNSLVWLAATASLSIEYLNQVVLRCTAGEAELGEYGAAWTWISLAILVLGQISRVGAASAARHTRPDADRRAASRFLARYILALLALGLAIGIPCLLVPEWLLRVFRSEYAAAAPTLRVLGIFPILYGPYLAVLQFLISSRLHRVYVVCISLAGAASVWLSWQLIPRLGSQGAAWSAVMSLALALAMFGFAVWHHLRCEGSCRASA